MSIRKFDGRRSLRRPVVERTETELTPDEYGEVENVAIERADLGGSEHERLQLVDVGLRNCVLSNARWSRLTARRLEILDGQLTGWQAHFDLAMDVYVADCRADFAAVAFASAKGMTVFERCRFHEAHFAGDLSTTVFRDCDLSGADFTRVERGAGCDLRGNRLERLAGLAQLRGARIDAEQTLQLSAQFAAELGFQVG